MSPNILRVQSFQRAIGQRFQVSGRYIRERNSHCSEAVGKGFRLFDTLKSHTLNDTNPIVES